MALGTMLQSTFLWAEELPHIVPTPDCPVGQTCCPSEIYCSYSEGCGETDFWSVFGDTVSPFEGVKQFDLYKISAAAIDNKNTIYAYFCKYGSPNNYISLIDLPYKLNGDWQLSGFGNTRAYCNSNNPLDCTGTKQALNQTLLRSLPIDLHKALTELTPKLDGKRQPD